MNKIDRNKCMKNDVSIELYGEIKYLMNEWVEESKKIINSKERLEKEVQELRKKNEDLDIETAKTLNLNTPTNKKDKKLYEEMMRDVGGVYFDGVDLKLLHKLKQKYTSNKYCMSELIEELTNIINAKSGLEKEVQELRKENEDLDIELGRIPHLKEQVREIKEENERLKKLEKEIESLRKKNSDLENGMDDMNENFGEIIEYEVSERMGEDYINLYGREIAVLKGDIRFLKKEKVELEDKNISLSLRVRDMERANLKNTKN